MVFNVGADVPLSWVNGSDAGPAQLVVTDPTGTATMPPPVTAVAGTYSATFRTSLPGLHQVRWSTQGAVGAVFEDVFEVRPAVPTALVSIKDAREWLRLRSTDTSDDLKIQSIIEAASRLVVNITGPIQSTSFTEWFDGGVPTIVLAHPPIISIVRVVEYYGQSTFVLSEQPLGSQTSAFAFTVDYTTGQLTRRTIGGDAALFVQGDKNIAVTYTAGRMIVPENVQLATKELVRHLYQNTQVQGRSKLASTGDDGYGEVPIGFAVPNFVVQMLHPDRRAPGIA